MTVPEKFKSLLGARTLIIDTETTGLESDAEIVEITVIDTNGNVLLDELVHPVNKVPAEATKIHGITNEMVEDARPWIEVLSDLWNIIVNEQGVDDKIAIYNSSYDVKLIKQSTRIAIKYEKSAGANSASDIAAFEDQVKIINSAITSKAHCIMKDYALFNGEKSDRGGYRWIKLSDAADQCGVKVSKPAHRAKADCLTTLAVMKAVAKMKQNSQPKRQEPSKRTEPYKASSSSSNLWLWVILAVGGMVLLSFM